MKQRQADLCELEASLVCLHSKSQASWFRTVRPPSWGRGVEIDYFSMMTEGEEILKGKKPMTEEYEKKINALYEFYDKALSRLDKEHPFSP